MDTNYYHFQNSGKTGTANSSFSRVYHTSSDTLNVSSTIHVNPMCISNKILLNKNKLSSCIRKVEPLKPATTAERIYYNPKFFSKPISSISDIHLKTNNVNQNNSNEVADNESNIYISRQYLHPINNEFLSKSSNFPSAISPINPDKIGRRGIYFNPKFLINQKQLEKVEKDNVSNKNTTSSSSQPPNMIISSGVVAEVDGGKNYSDKNNAKLVHSKSKYKLIKNNFSLKKTENNSKPLCFKTKYSLKRLTIGSAKDSDKKSSITTKMKLARLSSEFKKLSSTKLVRKSVLQSIILARRQSKNRILKKSLGYVQNYKKNSLRKKSINMTYYPKNNKSNNDKSISIVNNSFKRLSQTKIVRKSLLQSQIEARNQVKKQYLRDHSLRCKSKSYLSKYRLRNDNLKKKEIVRNRSLLIWLKRKKRRTSDSSKVKCKKSAINSPPSKSLRKNNQPCPLYNRFGRCKGKERGTCSKLHDPKYISICRKFLLGDCNASDCLLSHDVRPGKMPTCHHYLAGLCTRQNCPYLHIKVNPKAPICMEFLRGFCPDVFNCLKRHEFICPIYAAKQTCPKGKSCTYPHRSPVVHSKLLKDDQKPLINRSDSSKTVTNSEATLDKVSGLTKTIDGQNLDEKSLKTAQKKKKCKKEFVKESFARYFTLSNDEKSIKEETSSIVIDASSSDVENSR